MEKTLEEMKSKYDDAIQKYNDSVKENENLETIINNIKEELRNLYEKRSILENPKKYRKNKNHRFIVMLIKEIMAVIAIVVALVLMPIMHISINVATVFLICAMVVFLGFLKLGITDDYKDIKKNNNEIDEILANNTLEGITKLIQEKELIKEENKQKLEIVQQDIKKYETLIDNLSKTYNTLSELGSVDKNNNEKIDNSVLKRTREKGEKIY